MLTVHTAQNPQHFRGCAFFSSPKTQNFRDYACFPETTLIWMSLQSPYRTVLRDNAVPTIFDLTSHLNNPHSRHRKRIKELVSL